MKLLDIRGEFLNGNIEKKTYWTLMREKMTFLPELQELVGNNDNIEGISILKDGIILTCSDGIKIYFDFTQTICRAEVKTIMGGDVEQEDFNIVNQFLDEHNVIFDIGGNVGIYSMALYAKHKNCVYHCFEPVPSTYEGMLKNLRLNSVPDDCIIPYNVGFSDEMGQFDFYLPGTNEAASLRPINDEYYMIESDKYGKDTGRKKNDVVQCKVTTIDSFCRQKNIDRIDFIKIDVEGNEFSVLRGGESIIASLKPLIYCELLRKHAKRFGYHPNDVVRYMEGLGYLMTTIRNNRLVLVDSIDEDTEETNFFFFHKNKHSVQIDEYLKRSF